MSSNSVDPKPIKDAVLEAAYEARQEFFDLWSWFEEQGYSTSTVAKESGVSRSTFYAVERREDRVPSQTTLAALRAMKAIAEDDPDRYPKNCSDHI